MTGPPNKRLELIYKTHERHPPRTQQEAINETHTPLGKQQKEHMNHNKPNSENKNKYIPTKTQQNTPTRNKSYANNESQLVPPEPTKLTEAQIVDTFFQSMEQETQEIEEKLEQMERKQNMNNKNHTHNLTRIGNYLISPRDTANSYIHMSILDQSPKNKTEERREMLKLQQYAIRN